MFRWLFSICKPLYPALAVSIPLLALNRISSFVLPASIKYLVDDILVGRKIGLLHLFLLVAGTAAVVQGGTALALSYYVGRAQERLLADLRAKLQAHIVSLPLTFHQSKKKGALASSIMVDVNGITGLFSAGLIETGGAAIGAGVAFFVLFRIQPAMACAGLSLILLHSILSQYAIKKVKKMFEDFQQTYAAVMGRLNETLAGVHVVKAYNAEDQERRAFREGALQICHQYFSALMNTESLRMISLIITGVGSVAVLYYGAWKVLSGELTLGGLITFSVILPLLMAPIAQMAGLTSRFSQALASADRTLELFDQAPESCSPRRTVRLSPIKGKVSFENVSFEYQTGRRILHEISFEAEPGAVTALVGRSGAGKSTIAALIASLYAPQEGRVMIDGVDLATVSHDSYRSQLGVVLQDTFLFDGTILENVAFSRSGASENDIIASCKFAGIDEFVEKLPDKYRSIVGEQGVKLSGGQRQRIAIARAMLANPKILILDEPTSSLDAYAEEQVLNALRLLMAGRTTFIIAHRMSLFRSADQILVIEDGRLCERGTHQSLSAAGGRYQALAAKSAAAVDAPLYNGSFTTAAHVRT